MYWLTKINRTFVLLTKTVHQTFTHWGFWDILFYVDTLIVCNIIYISNFNIKFCPRKNFWSWELSLLLWVVGSVKLQNRALLCELVLSHIAPAVSTHNLKASNVRLSCEAIWPVIHVKLPMCNNDQIVLNCTGHHHDLKMQI